MSGLSHEPKFKQDVKTRSKHSGEDVIYGMGGPNEDETRMYIHTVEVGEHGEDLLLPVPLDLFDRLRTGHNTFSSSYLNHMYPPPHM